MSTKRVARLGLITAFTLCAAVIALTVSGLPTGADSSANLFAPVLSAVKSVAFSDGDGDGKVEPGQVLTYTVAISNTGPDAATGVTLNDTLQNITTLVPGSVIASPIAVNDSYSTVGNVGITVPLGSGVLANDLNPNGSGTLVITAAPTTSVNGGNVSVNTTTGAFTYNPAPGYEGTDTFTYTLSNGTGLTDTSTVSISVTGMIWFVNNAGAACTTLAAGCGRLSNPFSTLAALQAINNGAGNNPAANDNIFVYESATAYPGGITLLSGQKLIGQDATASLAAISGVTLGTFSNALPAMNIGGSATNFSGTTTVNTNSVLRGFSVNSTTVAGINDPAGAITGVNISEIATVTTTTGTAVSLSDAGATVSIRNINASGGANGIILTNTTGSFIVTGDGSLARNSSGGVINNTSDDAIRLTNATNVTLQSMDLTSNGAAPVLAGESSNTGADGKHTVQVTGGSNVILTGILISASDGSGYVANNLGGTNRITGSLFTSFPDGDRYGVFANNVNTNMTLLEFRNNTMNNSLNDSSMFLFENTGTSNMTLDMKGNTFENLDIQAVSIFPGGTAAGTTGTLTATVGGPLVGDRNNFQNARSFVVGGVTVTSENNIGVVAVNGGTGVVTIENNLFSNIAEDGTVAGTSIIRTQNGGGKLTATVRNNTIQNVNYLASAGGRHVIGHIFEPAAFNAGNFSNLTIDGNTATNVTYTGTSREFILLDYRAPASGGNVKIQNNSWNMPSAGTQQGMELRFRQTNASTVNLLVSGNTGSNNTAVTNLDIDSEAAATVNATVTNNNLTNTAGVPGFGIGVATEAAGASGCFNISGNTLTGNNSIDLAETLGTMTITQASSAALSAANGGAVVTQVGTPSFGAAPCATPPFAPETSDEVAAYAFDDEQDTIVTETTVSETVFARASALLETAQQFANAFAASVSPTVYAQKTAEQPNVPLSGETVTKALGTLPAGETVTVQFQATVDVGPYQSGVDNITNTANITAAGPININSNTTSVPLDAAPDLSVTKTDGGSTTQPAVTLTYTLNYSNVTGPSGQNAVGVQLSETVPANTTFNAAASSPGWSCADGSPGGTACTFTVGSLNAGDAGSKTFVVNVLAALPVGAVQISNTGAIAESPNVNGTDPVAGNNSSTDTTNIIGNWLGTTSADWNTAANWSNGVLPPSGNNISVPNVVAPPAFAPTISTGPVTVGILTLNKNLTFTSGATLIANGSVALGTSVISGSGTLELGGTATITRTTGQVNSTLRKVFLSTGPFTYPVGTLTGYSPLVVDVTALTPASSLTVKANDGTVPPLNDATTLDRYWTLTESGDLTANLLFTYLQADVDGNEANYRTIRVTGGVATPMPNVAPCPGSGSPCVDPGANTIKINGVSAFSDWTAGELAPTAAPATVSGRVFDSTGRGVGFARVELVGSDGIPVYAMTNPFGYYRFSSVGTGQAYVVGVVHKRFTFAPQTVTVNDNVTDLDFIADPQK